MTGRNAVPNARRTLYTAEFVQNFRTALREARADLHDVHFRYLTELAAVHAEVRELRSILEDLIRASRMQAEGDVATLRRQLETALARIERDQQKPLH